MCVCVCVCMITEPCLILCSHMDCGPPGPSVHGIFQARILEWVAISYFRKSSQPKDQTQVSFVSCISRSDSLPLAPPRKPIIKVGGNQNVSIHSMHAFLGILQIFITRITCNSNDTSNTSLIKFEYLGFNQISVLIKIRMVFPAFLN